MINLNDLTRIDVPTFQISISHSLYLSMKADDSGDTLRNVKDSTNTLTQTETALLESLCTGKTNQQLAELHGVSINTVKFHLHNIFAKFDVKSRKQAIAYYGSLRDPPESN